MGNSCVVPEHKSGDISKMHKDRVEVTMEGLQELTNALSNSTTASSPRLGVHNRHPKLQSKISGKRVLIEEYSV